MGPGPCPPLSCLTSLSGEGSSHRLSARPPGLECGDPPAPRHRAKPSLLLQAAHPALGSGEHWAQGRQVPTRGPPSSPHICCIPLPPQPQRPWIWKSSRLWWDRERDMWTHTHPTCYTTQHGGTQEGERIRPQGRRCWSQESSAPGSPPQMVHPGLPASPRPCLLVRGLLSQQRCWWHVGAL